MQAGRLWLGGILAGGVGLLVLLALAHRPVSVSQRDFQRLHDGMSRQEVEQALGGPPQNLLSRQGTVWVPHQDGSRRSKFLHRESPDPNFFPERTNDHDQAVWITPTGLIAVAYGRDGRVGARYFSTVDVAEGPSLLGWIASRPAQIRRSLGF